MHHKRGRCKNARGGCLMCKYYKQNGIKDGRLGQPMQERRARVAEREQRSDRSQEHRG